MPPYACAESSPDTSNDRYNTPLNKVADVTDEKEEQNPLTQRKKSVSFHRRVRVKRVPTLDSYSEKHLNQLYYSREEFCRMRKQIVREIRMLEDVDITHSEAFDADDESCCLRGLESETFLGKSRRRANKSRGRQSVMETQKDMEEVGDVDPVFLASIYEYESRDAVATARAIAVLDSFYAINLMV